jgi:hypothetical protein
MARWKLFALLMEHVPMEAVCRLHTSLIFKRRRMPTLDETQQWEMPKGTRVAQARVDLPGSATKVTGRMRPITYVHQAIDRAAKAWVDEFKEYPDWEDMFFTVAFDTFEVVVEVSDRFAHGYE